MSRYLRLDSAAILLAALAAASGCSHRQPAVSGAVPSGGPQWTTRGSGAFNDGSRAFYGVGVATGIQNPALARSTAEGRARTEIAATLNTYITSLMRDYQASVGNVQASQDEQMVEQTTRQFVNQDLSGARIIEHWQDSRSGTLFALSKLDFEQAQQAFDRMRQLNSTVRDYIRANAERAFDRLDSARVQPRP